MTKIFGLMVTKDEGSRYLGPVLRRLQSLVDEVFVFDDRSEDDTVGIASKEGAHVHVREVDRPSFLENESAFRLNGQRAFEKALGPKQGDWILCLDADEMLSFEDREREVLEQLTEAGRPVKFRVAEAFDLVNGQPFIRVDGYWRDITAVRYYPWKPAGQFPDRRMACGSVPTYAMEGVSQVTNPTILHYGYATAEDRIKKYARYIAGSGHNSKHIDSILRHPTLVAWEGGRL